MRILAHRGYWKKPEEKNSKTAFLRALEFGFGIETDLRDSGGQVVVSHDMPRGGEMTLEQFCELCRAFPQAGPLALNIKSDGLQTAVVNAMKADRVSDYYAFDMSVADMLGWIGGEVPVYTRQSEHEQKPVLYEKADGVWLDAFESDWFGADVIAGHLQAGKKVCVVSPELHGRDPVNMWRLLCEGGLTGQNGFSICTDRPEMAREFFV